MINSFRGYLTHSHSVTKRQITASVAASPQTCSLRIVAFRSKGAVTGCADQVNYAWDRRRRLPRLFAARPDRTDSRGSNNRNEYKVANKLCRRSFAPRKTSCFFFLPLMLSSGILNCVCLDIVVFLQRKASADSDNVPLPTMRVDFILCVKHRSGEGLRKCLL